MYVLRLIVEVVNELFKSTVAHIFSKGEEGEQGPPGELGTQGKPVKCFSWTYF